MVGVAAAVLLVGEKKEKESSGSPDVVTTMGDIMEDDGITNERNSSVLFSNVDREGVGRLDGWMVIFMWYVQFKRAFQNNLGGPMTEPTRAIWRIRSAYVYTSISYVHRHF